MTKADPENRFAGEQLSDGLDGISQWLRVARAVAEKNAVWLGSHHCFVTAVTWEHGHSVASTCKVPGDVVLHSKIKADDMG